jgi:hypothetical protein
VRAFVAARFTDILFATPYELYNIDSWIDGFFQPHIIADDFEREIEKGMEESGCCLF